MLHWHFLVAWACCFASIVCAAALNDTSALSTGNGVSTTDQAAVRPFVWSSTGDSWASGMPYGAVGNDNKEKCLRNDQGYAVKVSEDGSWLPKDHEQDFHVQACSGTSAQLDDIKDNTDMILLQSGATNANLTAVTYACIFAPERQDWGPAYPDPKGRCYQEIEKSQQYIFGKDENQLSQDARELLNSIFDHDKVKDNPDFRLLISGYFEFFYAKEDSDGDWCDSASFALRKNDRPKLSLALRKKMNELVRGLNDGVKGAVADSSHSHRTEFIDVNSQIEGHRFCQPGHTMLDQYFGDKVYLWNMSPDGIVLNKAGSGSAATSVNNTHEVREPTLEEFQRWRETGLFTADHSELPINMTDVANAGLGITPRSPIGGSQFDSLDSTLHEYTSMALRAFHPKDQGHAAIAQIIATALKSAPPKKPTPINTDPHYKFSVQILLAKHGNVFSWYMYRGPFGRPVDPCYPKNSGFVTVVEDAPETRTGLALNAPPYVFEEVEWYVRLENSDPYECLYYGRPERPGEVRCGDWGIFPLTRDAGYTSPSVHCNVDSRNHRAQDYHQAWVLEY